MASRNIISIHAFLKLFATETSINKEKYSAKIIFLTKYPISFVCSCSPSKAYFSVRKDYYYKKIIILMTRHTISQTPPKWRTNVVTG